MTDTVEEELRSQLREAFAGADFPVADQMELVPVLPDGPATTFEAGEKSYSAMELAAAIGDHQEFPYESADALVDDVIAAMEAEGML